MTSLAEVKKGLDPKGGPDMSSGFENSMRASDGVCSRVHMNITPILGSVGQVTSKM